MLLVKKNIDPMRTSAGHNHDASTIRHRPCLRRGCLRRGYLVKVAPLGVVSKLNIRVQTRRMSDDLPRRVDNPAPSLRVHAPARIGCYVDRWHHRPHSRLNYRTADEVRRTWADHQRLQKTAT
jgi:hypothetical protein